MFSSTHIITSNILPLPHRLVLLINLVVPLSAATRPLRGADLVRIVLVASTGLTAVVVWVSVILVAKSP